MIVIIIAVLVRGPFPHHFTSPGIGNDRNVVNQGARSFGILPLAIYGFPVEGFVGSIIL
jgi:hypothetical protein